MTITDAVSILGPPQSSRSVLHSTVLSTRDLQGTANYTWSAPTTIHADPGTRTGFRLTADAGGKIIEIAAPFSGGYHTAEGLAPGTREETIFTRLGAPSRTLTSGDEKYDIYDTLGIVFLVENNPKYMNHGLVNRIWVFPPAAP
jgi:hypothetical protein